MVQKRILRYGKYYVLYKDINGRIITLKRWHPNFKEKLTLGQALRIKKTSRIQKQAKKLKIRPVSLKNIKPHVIETQKFKKVSNIRSSRPIIRKRGVMVIDFLFISRRQKLQKRSKGYSNNMSFPREYKKGFDLCLRRAASKVGFSWDRVIVKDVQFSYWVKNA